MRTIIITALLSLVLTGCGASDEAKSGTVNDTVSEQYSMATTAEGVRYFEGTVTEVDENSMLVTPTDNYIEAKSYEKISVSNWFTHEVQVGDVVTVYYDGLMCEISPPFPNEIYKMTTMDENNKLITVCAEDEKSTGDEAIDGEYEEETSK